MKRMFAFCAAALLAVAMTACSSVPVGSQAASGNAKKVMLVRAKEGGGEQLIIDHLKKMGYTVYDAVDASFSVEAAKDYGVVYISSAVNSSKIDSKLKQLAVPVVVSKTQVASMLGMGGASGFGEAPGVKTGQIKDGKHPAAAGLKDTVAIYKEEGKISYSLSPSSEAAVIALNPVNGNAKQNTIFAYEKGAKNALNEPVPARQVFFSLPTGQETNLTDNGWKLFDAAIQWAAQGGK
ncbi:hypothetical protein [Paenibacillus hamazuiensis]|uniref:hypothetical protein n=1 Tax=Paenibacillus hamazuiensis TaxID=2936508 RepID=UPI00200FDD43|nr:hypothetical protein [Paenibacillus hamazuiensis]